MVLSPCRLVVNGGFTATPSAKEVWRAAARRQHKQSNATKAWRNSILLGALCRRDRATPESTTGEATWQGFNGSTFHVAQKDKLRPSGPALRSQSRPIPGQIVEYGRLRANFGRIRANVGQSRAKKYSSRQVCQIWISGQFWSTLGQVKLGPLFADSGPNLSNLADLG